jgi:hypothetical protein
MYLQFQLIAERQDRSEVFPPDRFLDRGANRHGLWQWSELVFLNG